MASPNVFLDSNILLYTDDPRFPAKQKIAADLIEQHLIQRTGAISLQVLGEYFQNATRKMGLDVPVARQRTVFFSKLLCFHPKLDDILAAIDLHRIHQISFWDAMIVRASIQTGARILYSEDMQHGQIINGVEIINPFR
jgi:predicted nucleic acid-binding protein